MKSSLNGVIALLNKKQEAAFEVVFSLYYPRLVCFAKEYIPYEDARNAVQDAFISFWEKNPAILNEYQLQSYLYTSVKNNCLMYLQHEKIVKNYADHEEISMQNQIYFSALDHLDTSVLAFQEIETIIEKTLEELPSRCREIFVLSRMDGKKNQEIAKELNISVKAVEAQMTRALKAFRVALKDFLPLLAYLLTSNP
jgi:RNA polymerase sigma-70 factor (ECF subfamily)